LPVRFAICRSENPSDLALANFSAFILARCESNPAKKLYQAAHVEG
jgi:hypothetical protein